MSTIDPDELADLMAAMADDQTVVIAFVAAHRPALAGTVRHHLRQLARPDLAADPDEVEGLVWDVALFLQGRAGAWQPGGARPWNWAARGIAKLLADAIGHARADVDDELIDLVLPAPETDSTIGSDVGLDDLIGHPTVALLHQALHQIDCRDRDRQVHVEYRIQAANGDPSPAHTVGAQFELRPDHVRQIDRRLRRRLQDLARTNTTYAPLAELAWVTGVRRRGGEPQVAPAAA